MPGSGKSTLGRRLAYLRGMKFIDTDTVLEQVKNRSIQQLIDYHGIDYLRDLEGEVISQLDLRNHVIATGGSAVYNSKAIKHLGVLGVRVYLEISMTTLRQRVTNVESRGLAKMKSHSLPRLYLEREPLYQAAADIISINNRPITATSMSVLNQQLDRFFIDRNQA